MFVVLRGGMFYQQGGRLHSLLTSLCLQYPHLAVRQRWTILTILLTNLIIYVKEVTLALIVVRT